MNEEIKPEGKATIVELEEKFEPDDSEIKKVQKFASEVSPFLLNLLEAKTIESNKKT